MANQTAIIESVSVLRRWKSLEELMVLFGDDPRLIQCEQIGLLGTWKSCVCSKLPVLEGYQQLWQVFLIQIMLIDI